MTSDFSSPPSPAQPQPAEDNPNMKPLLAPQQQLLDVLPVTVWQADSQGQIMSLSARWQTLTGRSPVNSLGDAFWNSVTERERDRSLQQWQIACQQQQSFVIYLDLCQSTGSSFTGVMRGEPLMDDHDQQIGWVGTVQQVEAEPPLQSKLDYSQTFLQAVLDNLSNGIVACDAQGVLTLFNRATEEQYGCPFRPLHPEQWADEYDLYQADGTTPLAYTENPLYLALKGQSIKNTEVVIKPSNQQPHIVLVSGEPVITKDAQKLGAVVVLQDITQWKQAELELRKSEERWQLALQVTGDGLFDWNIVTNEAFLSLQWKQTLGYAEDEVEDRLDGWRKLLHPDDLEEVAAALEAHLQQRMPLYRAEFRMRCQDGSYKWILARGQTQWDDQGQPLRMIGTHQDITRQKLAEEKLAHLNQELELRVNSRDSQLTVANNQTEALLAQEQTTRQQAKVVKAELELYEGIIKNIQLSFLVWHAPHLDGAEALQLTLANPAAEKLLEIELNDKIGHPIATIFPDFVKQQPHHLLSLMHVIQSQQPCALENVPFVLPTGEERLFSLKGYPLPKDCVGVAFENITD